MSSFPLEFLLLGGLSALFLWIGAHSSFFSLPDQREKWPTSLNWIHVLGAFFCYFFVAAALVPLIVSWLQSPPHFGTRGSLVEFASWMNVLTSFLILLFLLLLLRFLPKQTRISLFWRPGARSWKGDGWIAFKAWLLSFPLVLFANTLLEKLTLSLPGVESLPDQLAVSFIKMTFANPLYLTLGSVTILFLAPVIEEILFRGFLQSYLRRYLGSRHAVFLTALCFSFFHYSPQQGVGNIPIIGSLLVLALFLGLVYEKRGSLFASMFLHASFNAFNLLNLYFLGDFPKGPL